MSKSISTDILELELFHLNNENRVSGKYIEVLHPSYKEFGASGKITYKRDYEGLLLPESDFKLENHEIVPLSKESCLSTYVLTEVKTRQKTNRSSIWVLYLGEWKLLFHQGTIKNDD